MQKSSANEPIYIPTKGFRAPAGAAKYLAVLCYPANPGEQGKIYSSLLQLGHRIVTGKRANRELRRAADRATKIIRTRRLPAAAVAQDMVTNLLPRTGPIRLVNAEFATSERVETYAELVTRHAERGNFFKSVWGDSKPVLHLALGFYHFAPKEHDIVTLCRDPVWLSEAVKNSAFHRAVLPAVVAAKESDFIQILPEEEDALGAIRRTREGVSALLAE